MLLLVTFYKSQLAGILLCGLCIFVAVTTYDFQSVITEKVRVTV